MTETKLPTPLPGRPKPAESPAGLQQESSAGPMPKRGVIGRPWKPGQSGNPSGKRLGSVSLKAALTRVLTRSDAEQIGRKLIARAKTGDVRAVRTLADLLGETTGAPSVAVANAATQEAEIQIVWPHDTSKVASVTTNEAEIQRELDGLDKATLLRLLAACEARTNGE